MSPGIVRNLLITACLIVPCLPAEVADPYAVPDGDNKSLEAFIQKMKSMRPKSRKEYIPHRKKSARAIIDAATRILDSKPDEATELKATDTKLTYLQQLVVYREGNVQAEHASFIEAVSSNESPAIANLGHQYQLLLQASDLKEDATAFADRAAEVFGEEIDRGKVSLIFSIGRALEGKGNKEAAAAFYRKLGPSVASSKDENVVRWGKKFEGMARLIELPGKAMEIKGKDLSGKEFDLAKLKGKVVLVDFWATWCGPCIAELPNVKKNYAAYHEKGFEVVGISLDTARAKVEKFVKDKETPWPTLFSDDSNANGWDHPLAAYYGIMSIPKAILVNKEGNVESLNARGAELSRLLTKLLGEPASDDDADHEEAQTSVVQAELSIQSGGHIYFDDSALKKKLETEAVKLLDGGKTVTMVELKKQLNRKSCKLKLAEPSSEVSAPDATYKSSLPSLLMVGTLYKCGRCSKWHVDVSSSVIISEDGAFVVNYHSFQNAKHHTMVAMTHDGRAFPVKEVLAASEVDDVVICRLDLGGARVRPCPISLRADVGSPVTVISHPSNRFFTMSAGKVSRYYFEAKKGGGKPKRVAITADFARGSSGGPVLNPYGDIIGIVASTNSVYYNSQKGDPRNLQMVFKQCVPAETILGMITK